ncbi:hypothetical protein B0H16DRAFT_1746865 [Mycena metata]|uniref:Uncharacterized protein n=1 Tax=Mycena metata TaxID=1033252 RepID=A0AAD7GWA1_9AGAR|nr:hypothetical protein B0H16DRAFT_1746865 [Mycena metata]
MQTEKLNDPVIASPLALDIHDRIIYSLYCGSWIIAVSNSYAIYKKSTLSRSSSPLANNDGVSLRALYAGVESGELCGISVAEGQHHIRDHAESSLPTITYFRSWTLGSVQCGYEPQPVNSPPILLYRTIFYYIRWGKPLPPAVTPLSVTDIIAIESLGLAQYHNICSWYLSRYRQHNFISTSATVHIGAVTSWPSGHQYEEHVEIALLAEIDVSYTSWRILDDEKGDLMGNGWTRYRADDVFNTRIMLEVYSIDPEGWLSQANHVFSHLEITSNLEDYVGNAQPAPGYLFLCPKEDFRTGHASFGWPNRPAYWSLDPEGIEALSTEEAEELGFPPFQLATRVSGMFWDIGVYAGLCQVHQGKGFNPDSQDVARLLGDPLYELSRDVNPPFAHVDDFHEAEETPGHTDTDDEWPDAQSSTHEDFGCDEGPDAEGGVREDSIGVEQPAAQVNQESIDSDCGYTGTKHQANLEPQTANDPRTGGGFIHRIFGALRQSLVVEADSDNIDSDPISPFLV